MLDRTWVAALALTLCSTILPTAAKASPLKVEVFNPGKDAIFPVTSTLIYGDKEAMLVDAQFERRYAQHLVELIRASGRTLKYVFISHSDPDYYFGLAEIKKAFPSVQILSTAQTAYLISATKDAKLQVWGPKLGAEAPEALYVPDAMPSDALTVDNETLTVKSSPNDSAHSYLWIPSIKTILGGISVIAGGHVWMADTQGTAGIDQWLQTIDDMAALKPEKVISGHFATLDTSPAQLDDMRNYLGAYKRAAANSAHSAVIVAEMTKAYTDLPGRETLEFGAKAFTGELPWHVASPYPPIGRVAEVNFGSTVFRLDFKDNRTMSFEGMSGPFKGITDTVQYTATEVGRNLFMVYWHEPSTGSNVVHIQDWNTGAAYTNIAAKDESFTHLKGTISILAVAP